MSAPPTSSGEPITSQRQLVEQLAAGCKPPDQWRIGTEHEKFVFRRADLCRVPYEGPVGIAALLEGLQRFGWEAVHESGRTIALSRGKASISLEPGGQFELSGAPLETVHETDAEIAGHLDEAREVTRELGLLMLGLGFDPISRREDVPWMPKGRYSIMRQYMPRRGRLGLDMMLRTATVQVNLDFASEADMVRKLRVGLALQPVATALFAASPFTEGRPNGFLTYRSHVWTDVDPDRSGMLPFAFESGFGFERYVDYILDMPMYFVYREGRYIDVAGQSFRDFVAGRLPGFPGEVARIGDWTDHLTTAFPEVRLKRFLEMRGADAGPAARLPALAALWVGLLYDETALTAAADLVADWTAAERQGLRDSVPRLGLAAPFRGAPLRKLALDVVELAAAGLRRRGRRDAAGRDEARFLDPIRAIAESGRTAAEDLLDEFHREWGGRIEPLFTRHAY